LLFRRKVEGTEVDGCPACGGVWFDKGELHALAKSPAALRSLGRIFVPGVQAGTPQPTGLCPRCNEPMTPFEFDQFRGVRLDRCKGCGGVWLDHGEAETIAEKLDPAAPAPEPAPQAVELNPFGPNSAVSSGLELAAGAAAPTAPLAVRFGGAAPAAPAVLETTVRDPRARPAAALTGGFWDAVREADLLTVQQQFEIAELFGFETRNKYAIRAGLNWIGWAAEQGSSALAFLTRQLLGHWRTFEITIFDQARTPVLRAYHPFRWIFQRLEISLADGTFLGAIQQRFSILSKRFDVEGPDGRVILTVDSPIWRIWTFPFLRGAEQVGVIAKRWGGLLTEGFTDRDTFTIQLGPTLSDSERALLLAAGIFIDLQYFEHKAHG